MTLFKELQATDGWLSPEGDFYPCRQNITDEDRDFYTEDCIANGHLPAARNIIIEIYEIENPDIFMAGPPYNIQEWLLQKNWIRVDIEIVIEGHESATPAQIDTLKAMLLLPISEFDFGRESAQEIIKDYERRTAHG